jgi:transcriptional regulator with XRE-family HTH domain
VFYDRLKEACKNAGTTPTALARELGLSTANTGHWNSGGTPGSDVLREMSSRLNVSIDYLLENTDNPSPNEPPLEGDNLKFALFGTANIDDDVMDDVKRYAEFVAQRKRERGSP